MKLSLENLNKPSNRNLKKIADYLLFTLPLVITALMAAPMPEPIKLWVIFGLNIVVIAFKGLTKFTSDETQTPTQVQG